nr:hypothetical protein [Tanacetum cinerariifolium]
MIETRIRNLEEIRLRDKKWWKSEGQSLHASRPSRLCAQAQLVDDMPFQVCTAITNDGTGVPNLAKRDFKNLKTTRASLVGSAFALTYFDNVVQAMMSPDGSIVASLENVNGFLVVNTSPDDLIHTDFEKEGVIPKVMLHIFKEFVLLLGRHSLNNEIPCMEENPPEQSRLGIFFGKEIFEGGVIRIHNAFVHDEGIFLKKMGHRPGYLRKVLYESWIEVGMTEKATNTLDGGGIRLVSSHGFNIFSKWERQVSNEYPKTKKLSMKTSIIF